MKCLLASICKGQLLEAEILVSQHCERLRRENGVRLEVLRALRGLARELSSVME